MAHSKIIMENNGVTKIAPIGFSWTVFFFNFFPPLIRGQIMMGIVMLVISMFTLGVSAIVLAFFYNRMYLNYLLEEGYRFKDFLTCGRPREEIEAKLGMKLVSK